MGFLQATAVAAAICLGAGFARAESYSAHGEIGFLQEWELKASLAKTASRTGDDYSGAMTLRHVGLCSANGVEEKSGTVELKVLPKTADIEGMLSLPDDQCRVAASAAQHYTGLLKCKNGEAIPIRLSIDTIRADHAP